MSDPERVRGEALKIVVVIEYLRFNHRHIIVCPKCEELMKPVEEEYGILAYVCPNDGTKIYERL